MINTTTFDSDDTDKKTAIQKQQHGSSLNQAGSIQNLDNLTFHYVITFNITFIVLLLLINDIILDPAFKQIILSPKPKVEKVVSSPGRYCHTGTSETREKPGLHTSGYSVMSQRKFANDSFGLKTDRSLVPKSNLCFLMPSTASSKIISPSIKRPVSAMDAKIRPLSVEEVGEQYWGEELQKLECVG